MSYYIQQNQQIYNELAYQYAERDFHKAHDTEKVSSMANFLLDSYSGSGNRYVEIGPGTGQVLNYFSQQGFETLGIELSEIMADIAKENSPDSKIINKNVLDCNLHPGSYDLIYASALIHLFPIKDALFLMQKIRNWLTHDGLLFLNTTTHYVNFEGYFKKEDYRGKDLFRFRRLWSEYSFISFVQNSGFEIIKSFKTNESSRGKRWLGLTCKKLEL